MTSLGDLSRMINRLTGGQNGESLCGRFARVYGSDSLICRAIDAALGQHHCLDERIRFLKSKHHEGPHG